MQGSPSVAKKKDVSSLFDEEDDEEGGGIFSSTKKPTSSGMLYSIICGQRSQIKPLCTILRH